MTNDTNTLNGALMELGETLANNLNNKGIIANASEGLTTLANKIRWLPGISQSGQLLLEVTGANITFPNNSEGIIIGTGGGLISFGEGEYSELNSGSYKINHTYTDGESIHTILVTGVTSLGNNCFANCSGLTSISIPDGMISLGAGCFANCSGLTSISIPDSITSLGDNCFTNCSGLTNISIPEGVTSLGNYCFRDCTGLTSIICNWSEATDIVTYNSYWIYGANSNLKFSIPYGTTSLYTSAGYPSEKLEERASLTLTGDKNILSSYDSETATLTATYSDGTGATVELYDNTDTLVDEMTDNEDGTYSYVYSATGAGDVGFYAKVGTLVSETYSLTDAIYVHTPEITQTGSSGDHFTAIDNDLSLTLPSKFEWTWKMKSTCTGSRLLIVPVANKTKASPNYSIGGQQVQTTRVGLYKTTSVNAVGSDTTTTGTEYHNWKIVRDGTTFKWYFDDTQINSDITLSWFDNYTPKTIGFMYWSTGTINVKDIVIKAL